MQTALKMTYKEITSLNKTKCREITHFILKITVEGTGVN